MMGVLPLVFEPSKNRPYIDEWREYFVIVSPEIVPFHFLLLFVIPFIIGLFCMMAYRMKLIPWLMC